MSSSWPNFLAASGNGMRGLVADSRLWTLFFCISNSPQNRHPERSASQIVRVTRCLVARSRRTPTVLYLLVLFGAFQPLQPFSVSARYANKQGTWKVSLRPIAASTWITAHERIYARPLARTRQIPIFRLRWLKSSETADLGSCKGSPIPALTQPVKPCLRKELISVCLGERRYAYGCAGHRNHADVIFLAEVLRRACHLGGSALGT
jgi:hypothetical protein